MAQADKEILDRLGQKGLRRVLDDVLDGAKLVRLANACGLKYPGMRTQAQKRPRILADLVEKVDSDPAARRAVHRHLQKEIRPALKKWSGLDDAAQRERLRSVTQSGANGSVGRHLLLLAWQGAPEVEPEFLRLQELATGAVTPSKPADEIEVSTSRTEARLHKKVQELQRRLQRTETQVARAKDAEKDLKKDLTQRKGELAESRMLADRLRDQLTKAEAKLATATQNREPVEDALTKLARTVRKLAAEQKATLRALDKVHTQETVPSRSNDDAFHEAIKDLRKEMTGIRREQKKEIQTQVERAESLSSELRQLKTVARAAQKVARPRRSTSATDSRVGVFIDVQNVYYGARHLKGKLDFDALMESALLGRRLIQATAYVVESKTTDQSGFLAILGARGIEVRRKSLKVRADGSMKGDWDMELALDILDAARDLDVVVLVSGDGDFTSLVQRVKRTGPRVEVFAFPRNTAKALQEAADRYQPLDRNFMIYPSRHSKPAPEQD